MKVLHVVTLASQTGAFGGPFRVALNQAQVLAERGHDVTIVAGWEGGRPTIRTLAGVTCRLFPVRQAVPGSGFSGLWAWGLVKGLRHIAVDADVVHVHMGRDLITVAAAMAVRKMGIPFVVQTHGMIGDDVRLRAKLVDKLQVRSLLRAASRRFVLGDEEMVTVRRVLRGNYPISVLRNGVSIPDGRWNPVGREVLYCARLHPRKRPLAFVDMASELIGRHVESTFAIIGPDEGELGQIMSNISERGIVGQIKYEGALEYGSVLDRIRAASVYVLPSVDEPFPMSLLEALSLGVPSVCTSTCHIAGVLSELGAAVVTDGTAEGLANAVQSLLENPDECKALSDRARSAAEKVFSLGPVVDDLERHYSEIA